ncbi:MAG: hypothetical protein ACPGVO_04920 [Spirulinaceae cyanobacterium]
MSFIFGLDGLKGLEYLSAQELLAYINWPRASANVETDLSFGDAIDEVAWGDDDEDLGVPEISDLPATLPETLLEPEEPHPSSFLVGLDGFTNLAALSVAEFVTEISWQDGRVTATATTEDLSLLGDLLVEFPE